MYISYRVHNMTKAWGCDKFNKYGKVSFKCGNGEKEELGGSGKT